MAQDTAEFRQSQVYRRRWWTLTILAVSVLVIIIDATILNVALPTLQRELGATGSELQWMLDAYILAFAALLLIMGALGDRYGRAHALRAGMIIFGLASVAAIYCETAGQLIVARSFMGIGAALILPATLSVMTNVFPRDERGKAIGVWAGMNGIGIALGPIVGGLLIEHFNWSAIFVFNIPFVILALVLGHFLIPNSRDPKPQRLDYLGTVLSAAGLSVFVFGLIKGGDWGWTNATVVGTLAGGVALGTLFLLWERRTSTPLLDVGLFRNQRFSAGTGTGGLVALSQVGMFFGMTLYLQFVLGYSALETGIRFLPFAFGFMIGAGMAHRLTGRFGSNLVIMSGFIGVAALAIAASFWQTDTAYWVIGLIFFVWAFFMGNIRAPAADAVMGAVPEERAGVASGVLNVTAQVGAAIGIAALGSVLNSVYTSSVRPLLEALPALPAETMEAALDSVGSATVIAEQLPAAMGEPLRLAAHQGFMDAWQAVTFVVCAIALVAGIVALRWMPPHHLPEERAGKSDLTAVDEPALAS